MSATSAAPPPAGRRSMAGSRAGAGLPWRQLRAIVPGGRRLLHGSGALCGSRNLLKKFASKTKKKFWYDSPTVVSHVPSSMTSLLKATLQKTRREDSIRKRTLNILLYKAVTDLTSTCEVSQEFYDLKLELTKVSIAHDYSACRVYWTPPESAEEENRAENIIQKSAPRIRHLLITHQVLRTVPPIVFIKDKEAAAVNEINKLLAIADFGPEEEKDTLAENYISETESSLATSSSDTSTLSIPYDLFGIDHKLLNKQIMEYKKMKKIETGGSGWTEQHQKQLAEIQKQKKMKKKKIRDPFENDITPQKYFLDKYSEDSLEGDIAHSQDSELDCELQEVVNELKEDGDRS